MTAAIVDLGAIAANVRTVAAVTRTPLMAVVKADGFGHGAVPVARAALAAGATWLGVTSAAEALSLRDNAIDAPILSWLHPVDEDFGRLIAARVDIGVSTVPHLHAVAAAGRRLGTPARVHLKADTGLARNGASADRWPELVAWARKHEEEQALIVRSVWSHLDGANPLVGPFEDALRAARGAGLAPELTHLAGSAAALTAPATRLDLCRIGIALYGYGAPGLRPAMTLVSRIVNVKRVPAGTGVSYGPDHVTTRATTLALLPLGFADGLPRTAEGRAQVELAGRRCPIVGRIAMDQCVIDAGDLPVAIGDPVTVFGSAGLTAADWARWAGTNPHEVLTGIGARILRSYR